MVIICKQYLIFQIFNLFFHKFHKKTVLFSNLRQKPLARDNSNGRKKLKRRLVKTFNLCGRLRFIVSKKK